MSLRYRIYATYNGLSFIINLTSCNSFSCAHSRSNQLNLLYSSNKLFPFHSPSPLPFSFLLFSLFNFSFPFFFLSRAYISHVACTYVNQRSPCKLATICMYRKDSNTNIYIYSCRFTQINRLKMHDLWPRVISRAYSNHSFNYR